jgi:hypothetical protein
MNKLHLKLYRAKKNKTNQYLLMQNLKSNEDLFRYFNNRLFIYLFIYLLLIIVIIFFKKLLL